MKYFRGDKEVGGGTVLLRWLCGIKNLPAMQETLEMWLLSLGWTDPLEEENGNLLQYSCLKKNPMDRGAWRVTVQNVLKSPT